MILKLYFTDVSFGVKKHEAGSHVFVCLGIILLFSQNIIYIPIVKKTVFHFFSHVAWETVWNVIVIDIMCLRGSMS